PPRLRPRRLFPGSTRRPERSRRGRRLPCHVGEGHRRLRGVYLSRGVANSKVWPCLVLTLSTQRWPQSPSRGMPTVVPSSEGAPVVWAVSPHRGHTSRKRGPATRPPRSAVGLAACK